MTKDNVFLKTSEFAMNCEAVVGLANLLGATARGERMWGRRDLLVSRS